MKKLISFIFLTICVLLLSGCFLLPSESKTYHSVTFEVDGDSTSLRIEDGKKVEKIEDPTKEGYEFIGWYLDDSPYDFSKAVTKKITDYSDDHPVYMGKMRLTAKVYSAYIGTRYTF